MMASSYSAIPSTPPRNRFHSSDEDLSVISEGTSTSLSSGEDSNLQCASPSSSYGMASPKKVTLVFDNPMDGKKAVTKHRSFRVPSGTKILKEFYGTADLSDRIGRTLSFLLVARLALSFLLATIDGEE